METDKYYEKIKDIIDSGDYKKNLGQGASRGRAWEQCFRAFKGVIQKGSASAQDIDSLSAHLYAFLACWGMQRNSKIMTNLNHTFFNRVCEIMISDEYKLLRAPSEKEIKNPEYATRVYDLYKDILDVLTEEKEKYEETIDAATTPTLISKIMLGGLGCIPAYDRFFKDALSILEISPRIWGKHSIEQVCQQLVLDSPETVKLLRVNSPKDYPIMKNIDLALWSIGKANSD